MKELLRQLRDSLSKEIESTVQVVLNNESYKSGVFEDCVKLNQCPQKSPRPVLLWGRNGIYIFVIKNDIVLSDTEVRTWNSLNQGASFQTYSKQELHKGDILYIGDCVSISLYTRIRQHYASDQSYTSLRLGHKSRTVLQDNVQIFAFPIKKDYDSEDIRIILPNIEKQLHNILKPKTGSSRV